MRISDWSSDVCSSDLKFCSLQPQQGQFDFRSLDRLMDFAAQNQMTVRGHNLVWHQCLPGWVANGKFSREEAIKLLRDHIYTVVEIGRASCRERVCQYV